uniref:G8 domain-containing protein n=1 Tax=Knipowitschia caucasica TaxID=637954 RepID=A0AAV2K2L6_KNICA
MEKPHLKKKPRRFCEHCSLELSHAQYYDHRRRYFRNGVWEKNLQRTRSDNAQILLSRHTGGRSVRPGAGETHEREMQTEHPGKEVKEEHEDNDETADDQNIHLFMDSSDSESVQDEDLSCHEHPDGPSYDPNICQKKVPLGEFFNNTAHSQGWFALWIFQDYFPVKEGKCGSKQPEPAVFNKLTAWNCEKGAEWVNVGAVHFNNFLMVNNEKAGTEHKRILINYIDSFSPEGGAVVSNSVIVGRVDELGLDLCTFRGIIAPLDDGLSVINTTFINFDRSGCAAIGVARIDGTCIDKCGGWAVRFSHITYHNTPNKAGFRWEHEVQLLDMDGTLTGHKNYKVVPTSGLLDPAHCSQSPDWSVAFNGSVCDDSVNFHRLAFNNPLPSSIAGHDTLLSNQFGGSSVPYMKKRMTHTLGWMALLPSDMTYMWSFDDAEHITNISYTATFYGFKPSEFVIIGHNFTQSPDRFHVVDNRNGSAAPLSFSQNQNGDWYFHKEDNSLYYMVSGKTSEPRSKGSADPSLSDVDVQLKVYRCFYPQCIAPTPPPPATLPPLPNKRPDNFIRWSDASFWTSSSDNNNTVPAEGADVVIPTGQWVVLDDSTPALNRLTVNGVLEIPDDLSSNSSSRRRRSTDGPVVIEATHIMIQGGRLVAGSPQAPFEGELHLRLRGNHLTPDWPLPEGPNLGSKALGVFGILELYGKPSEVYHTKLSASSAAGTNTLALATAVDWKVGDEVAISTTSYDAWETEKHVISAVSQDGLTLTLDTPLAHTHIAETHTVAGTAHSYTLAADVALLSRNIKIIGAEYEEMEKESFGARVLVGTFSFGGIDYKGKAQIRNVEFYRSGQEGWSDDYDPRYSVAFLNLEQVEDTYLQGCSFHDGFSPAIGVFNTEGLWIEDNVIHHTVGEGIRVWGHNTTLKRNLVMMTLWPGSYQDREEDFNYEWNAAIEVNRATSVVLRDNIVAGYERVAFRIDGEPCPGTPNDSEMWRRNEAHGGLLGVYLNEDGLPECSLIQDFFVWKSYDYGIYFQVTQSMVISNVTLVDNGLGVLSLIYTPASITHKYSDKRVTIESSLVVGSSPNFNCSQTLPTGDFNVINSATHRIGRHKTGGRSGLCLPNFLSAHNTAPMKPFPLSMSYNAIKGLMVVKDTTFVGFKEVCSGQENFMFITNTMNEDLQHPVHVSGLKMVDSSDNNKAFFHRADVGKVNPSDCVDMECDAKKKSLLKDLDGSLLGAVGAVVPQSEYEWDGDARRGLGDYRIPKVMLTFPNGSRIPVDQMAPHKGVIRKDCTYMAPWQSYSCTGLDYRLLVIESLDPDSETRRLSPVAVLGDGYVDLINGPQDHGWCAGYTCQKRLSLFHAIVALNHEFEVFFSSVSPQKLRLMLNTAGPSDSVLVSVFYSAPQRLDVYVDNKLVAPMNAQWNEERTDYTLLEPQTPGTDPHGASDPRYRPTWSLRPQVQRPTWSLRPQVQRPSWSLRPQVQTLMEPQTPGTDSHGASDPRYRLTWSLRPQVQTLMEPQTPGTDPHGASDPRYRPTWSLRPQVQTHMEPQTPGTDPHGASDPRYRDPHGASDPRYRPTWSLRPQVQTHMEPQTPGTETLMEPQTPGTDPHGASDPRYRPTWSLRPQVQTHMEPQTPGTDPHGASDPRYRPTWSFRPQVQRPTWSLRPQVQTHMEPQTPGTETLMEPQTPGTDPHGASDPRYRPTWSLRPQVQRPSWSLRPQVQTLMEPQTPGTDPHGASDPRYRDPHGASDPRYRPTWSLRPQVQRPSWSLRPQVQTHMEPQTPGTDPHGASDPRYRPTWSLRPQVQTHMEPQTPGTETHMEPQTPGTDPHGASDPRYRDPHGASDPRYRDPHGASDPRYRPTWSLRPQVQTHMEPQTPGTDPHGASDPRYRPTWSLRPQVQTHMEPQTPGTETLMEPQTPGTDPHGAPDPRYRDPHGASDPRYRDPHGASDPRYRPTWSLRPQVQRPSWSLRPQVQTHMEPQTPGTDPHGASDPRYRPTWSLRPRVQTHMEPQTPGTETLMEPQTPGTDPHGASDPRYRPTWSLRPQVQTLMEPQTPGTDPHGASDPRYRPSWSLRPQVQTHMEPQTPGTDPHGASDPRYRLTWSLRPQVQTLMEPQTPGTDPHGASDPRYRDPHGASDPRYRDPHGASDPRYRDPHGASDPRYTPTWSLRPQVQRPSWSLRPQVQRPSWSLRPQVQTHMEPQTPGTETHMEPQTPGTDPHGASDPRYRDPHGASDPRYRPTWSLRPQVQTHMEPQTPGTETHMEPQTPGTDPHGASDPRYRLTWSLRPQVQTHMEPQTPGTDPHGASDPRYRPTWSLRPQVQTHMEPQTPGTDPHGASDPRYRDPHGASDPRYRPSWSLRPQVQTHMEPQTPGTDPHGASDPRYRDPHGASDPRYRPSWSLRPQVQTLMEPQTPGTDPHGASDPRYRPSWSLRPQVQRPSWSLRPQVQTHMEPQTPGTETHMEPQTPGQYVPPMNASAGSNVFDPEMKMLRVLVKGLQAVEVRTSPVLVLAFDLPAMTQDQFFGENLVQNLALFLKVPSNMIRVTKIVRADGRRRRRSTGLSVEVEIKQPPVQETTNATNGDEAFTVLSKIADDLGRAFASLESFYLHFLFLL